MDRIIEWFGIEKYHRNLQRVRDFWEGNERFLISINSKKAAYGQIFDDALILALAPENLKHQATLPGVNLPAFLADFGTISTAKYWRGQYHFDSTGKNIFIDPIARTIEDALTIEPFPVNHSEMDAIRSINLFNEISSKLNTKYLWLRTPDVQGPLSTAGLVLDQEELFISMFTQPDLVHQFIEKVTDFIIEFTRFFIEKTNNKICGYIWPYTFFPWDIGLSFTEDLMPLLSTELYREFAVPYLKKIAQAYSGLHIHCCGEWGRHAQTLKDMQSRIYAVEFHYPFTRFHEIECLSPETVFIPFISLDKQREFSSIATYYDFLLKNTDARFWFAFPEDTEEAIEFAIKYGF
ncbi:hypothetical protein JW964_06080 [candidate division KSB1 bacterium]|nr:hypothetical protein [candidate division KSB1 bacterium]